MAYIYAAIGSITSATRLSRKLSQAGINASILHTPAAVNKGGCSYSVRVRERERGALMAAAESLGIKIRSMYNDV